MKIQHWLKTGELSDASETTDDLLYGCARIMDKECLFDTFGNNIFFGDDGKLHRVELQAVIVDLDLDAEDLAGLKREMIELDDLQSIKIVESLAQIQRSS